MEELLNSLAHSLEGELHHSELMRALYATDASVYREMPLAVIIPKCTEDIRKVVEFASNHEISIIPRGAGTSLAGQVVGDGIILDTSKYMNQILELNTSEKWVRVQPGVVRDELNTYLKPYNLFFGPNTSTANRCNLGGMLGNNSCGSTSIQYGSTRDHVKEVKVVLSDATEVTFKSLNEQEIYGLRNQENLGSRVQTNLIKLLSPQKIRDEIKSKYPKAGVSRRNTGYALDVLVENQPFLEEGDPFNICKLLAGSEGTLAITTEIKLNLVEAPKPFDVVVAAHFTSIEQSLKAAVEAMAFNPTACELMDKTILDCTKDNIEQSKNRFFIEGDPEAVLLVEFRGPSLQATDYKAMELIHHLNKSELGYAFPIVETPKTERLWNLRKAGLGVLANIPGDRKAVACIEDTAVALHDLPAYIAEFSQLMAKFGQKAVYYAHAGAGELHLRPILDLKDPADVKLFREISEASVALVKKYRGSLSGEHGDGRVRSEFIETLYGKKITGLFRDIKQLFDPKGIFNPGKIVNPVAMDQNLRYDPGEKTPENDTIFDWSDTGGILRAAEKCNGSGDCRKLSFAGGTMCPSYRATLDEKDTTRARANALREFLTMNTKENPFNHPEIEKVMDLCIACKGCKSECPSNVDMATLKSEFLYQYHKSNPPSFSSRMFAKNESLTRMATLAPSVYNLIGNQNWFKSVLKVSKKRNLPKLKNTTLRKWYRKYKQPELDKFVYLFCDEFTDLFDPEIGMDAVKLLNHLGYEVRIIDHPSSGRALISKGFLEEARDIANTQVQIFDKLLTDEIPLLGLEPSAILGFVDEYPKLVKKELKQKSEQLASKTKLIDEFLKGLMENGDLNPDLFDDSKKKILVHGHCHQKALRDISVCEELLNIPSGCNASLIPSGCCGMAGSFGYEKEHYDISMKIGENTLFPAIRETGEEVVIVANGTSCRHQILDGTKRKSFHLVQFLYSMIKKD